MRPTSVIFLVISVIMIVFGLTVCLVAGNIATDEGIQLFPEYDENNDFVIATDITTLDTMKIEINANDANVNIIGGSAKSYVEVVNFKTNYYSLSAKDKVITFNEIPDMQSMIKFWENGFSFTGMRNLLIKNDKELGQKAINVYLTNEQLKQVKINITKGDVTVNNITANAEFELKVLEGSVKMDRVNSTDSLTLTGDNVDLNFSRARFKNLTVELKSTNAVFRKSNSTDMDISFTDGNFDCDNINSFYSITVKAETGTININGQMFQRSYAHEEVIAPESISVITKNGNVTIISNDATSTDQ